MDIKFNDVVKVHFHINGIYSWGEGFHEGMCQKWYDYFNNLNSIFWRVVKDKDHLSLFLVSVYGGAMIHPLDGITIYMPEHVLEGSYSAVNELRSIFENLANRCNTSYGSYIELLSISDSKVIQK